MFEYFKLKKTKLSLEVLLLGKLYDVVQMFEGGTDILELANKMKDVDQKDIIEELVRNITKEKAE